ncbi:MAG: hypothetical protein M3R36_12420 [Bacteroidota bacterium]|nr:hypothetical protein [Bacteroidota bacterium]
MTTFYRKLCCAMASTTTTSNRSMRSRVSSMNSNGEVMASYSASVTAFAGVKH